ncbi:MAG: hypothetical protein LC772_03495 [Chloroflexi bacterium]|nr:hypothetical protein [Chloroflexota bacterium]
MYEMAEFGTYWFTHPYTKNDGIYTCPSDAGGDFWNRNDTWLIPDRLDKADWLHPTSYFWKFCLDSGGSGGVCNGVAEAQLGHPAQMTAFSEFSAFHHEKQGLFGMDNSGNWGQGTEPPNVRSVNATFCDGHAKILRLTPDKAAESQGDANFDMNWELWDTRNGGHGNCGDLANCVDQL